MPFCFMRELNSEKITQSATMQRIIYNVVCIVSKQHTKLSNLVQKTKLINTDKISNESETPILRIATVMPSVFDSPEKERGIVIVEQAQVGRNNIEIAATKIASQGKQIVVIVNNTNEMNTIEINGIKYKQKAQERQKPMSKILMTLMIMAEMSNGYGISENSKPKQNPKVDIVKEFGLIQQKKSKQDWVVRQFERNFEQVS